ncbi:hypothetical protein CSA37_04865 [Candidatus Fermentibacteria bacterium]|nr:MAG: hypothetical protein CSA37_10155 [Candidatus Fermentibacteria bacterium]PIE52260.1 MAG: hypothetical protein CSA37_07260 [Candidatus Fermentibacteria bacterium]PIE52755.1 MAG: hypothetical protein CSA37_04865 [Candidatus Fermentibacteria bacterium]
MSLLVRVPNWLGDGIMALPAVNGIISRYPDAGIWAVKRVAPLYRMVFSNCQVHTFPELPSGHRYKKLLLLTSSFSSALAGVRAGIRQITGTPGDGRTPLLTTVRRIPEDRTRHHSLHYDAIAEAVDALPEMPEKPQLTRAGEKHIAVFAGARYGEAKMWKGFAEVASLLEKPCVFYGTVSEREYLEEQAGRAGAAVKTGLTLRELCENLLSASAVIGNDSGGVHLAAFLGRPTVVIFGSTSPAWTVPLENGGKVLAVTGSVECSPCFQRICPLKEPECFKVIDPRLVADMVRRAQDE